MNITRLNLKQRLPFILQSISDASLIALDLEMSGIVSPLIMDQFYADSIQNRYHKIKCKAERYIPLQLGLCTYHYWRGDMIYTPFNIYLYPMKYGESDAQEFCFNSETMRFLGRNRFDFNRFFNEGVPYLDMKRMKQLREMNEKSNSKRKELEDKLQLSPEITAFMNMTLGKVKNWIEELSGCGNSQPAGLNDGRELLIDIQFITAKAYEHLIATITKLYPAIQFNFQYLGINNTYLDQRNYIARKYLKIRQISNDTLLQNEPRVSDLQDENQKIQCGEMFNTIWQKIQERKVPLVVHNGFMDLLYVYHRFIDGLPQSQGNFKSRMNRIFPVIYDTKYLCSSNSFLLKMLNRETSLGNCYRMLRQQEKQVSVKVEGEKLPHGEPINQEKPVLRSIINSECKQYQFDIEKCHEAGYDALMTAYTFVNGMKLLKNSPETIMTQQFYTNSQFYCNKVPLSSIKIPYNFIDSKIDYERDGGKQFYFTCLFNQQIGENQQNVRNECIKIEHFLSNTFGPIRIYWGTKFILNFILSFIRYEDEQKFSRMILDESGYGLCNYLMYVDTIGDGKNNRYLVSVVEMGKSIQELGRVNKQ